MTKLGHWKIELRDCVYEFLDWFSPKSLHSVAGQILCEGECIDKYQKQILAEK